MARKSPNARLKCKECELYFKVKEMKYRTPKGNFHSDPCLNTFLDRARAKARDKAMRQAKSTQANARKARKRQDKQRLEALMTRTDWFKRLQQLLNRWVLHVRDKDKPCCTCGTTKPDIKYDAGHYITVGSNTHKRFIERNIHRQCSIKCNVHGSGMRREYMAFIVKTYGQEYLDSLEGVTPSLKVLYPHIDDIKAAIEKYRLLLKAAGVRSNIN